MFEWKNEKQRIQNALFFAITSMNDDRKLHHHQLMIRR